MDRMPIELMCATSHSHFEFEALWRVLRLAEYNTRLVVISTMLLGAAAGVIGSFLLLRKRSLMGDALSHATLPGIAIGFLVMVALGGSGKWLPGLLIGAAVFGLLGVGAVLLIRNMSRLKDDAALGIVLSVFFGLGVALLGLVSDLPSGSAAGLQSFIYGKTASMVRSDLLLIAGAGAATLLITMILRKELLLLCFDEEFARALGWRTVPLDIGLMTLVTIVTVIGLQAVGMILIIALLIIPSAAARFWTEKLRVMIVAAGAIGAVSGWVGGSLSALLPDFPAGAVIVLTASSAFFFSIVFGSSRGALRQAIDRRRLRFNVGRQHLLRAMWETREMVGSHEQISEHRLAPMRSWNPRRLRAVLARAQREALVTQDAPGVWRFTREGEREAKRIVHNHRLWEMFLITHADIAPSHVDRAADSVEHVLGPALVAELEAALAQRGARIDALQSPHEIDGDALSRAGEPA